MKLGMTARFLFKFVKERPTDVFKDKEKQLKKAAFKKHW